MTRVTKILIAAGLCAALALAVTTKSDAQDYNVNRNFTVETVSVASHSIWRHAGGGVQIMKVKDVKEGVACYYFEGHWDDNSGTPSCVKL